MIVEVLGEQAELERDLAILQVHLESAGERLQRRAEVTASQLDARDLAMDRRKAAWTDALFVAATVDR